MVSESDEPSYVYQESNPMIREAARIVKDLEFTEDDLQRNIQEFRNQIRTGLMKDGTNLSQIPTHVTDLPSGSEKGLYLAIDLGGTNFRVCSVFLHGNSEFTIRNKKFPVPRELMTAKSYRDLFSFMAVGVDEFIGEHLQEHWTSHHERKKIEKRQYAEEELFDLGFSFSFPVCQRALNRGELVRWTKGFDIQDAIGRDVCAMLQEALDERHLPVRVTALINDSVGTILTRAYTSRDPTVETSIGAIFGTGTNGAYLEWLPKIRKLQDKPAGDPMGYMIVNAEWGGFDDSLSVLPTTPFDKDLDAASNNPGVHMFEKRVSGMYLGEIVRRAMLALTEYQPATMFVSAAGERPPAIYLKNTPLHKPYALDTSFLSTVEADSTDDLRGVNAYLRDTFALPHAPSLDDCRAVHMIVQAVRKRAARLSAVPLVAIAQWTNRLAIDGAVDVGADGSLVERYPNYQAELDKTLASFAPSMAPDGVGKHEQDHHQQQQQQQYVDGAEDAGPIRISIAKDGSGVGAALGALIGAKTRVREQQQKQKA